MSEMLTVTEMLANAWSPGGFHSRGIVGDQSLEIGDDSIASDPFGKNTGFIVVNATSACCLAFGKEPKAEQGKHRMSAGETRQYGVMPGDRIAVIGSL
jgi:hypothetical protein